MATRSGTRQQKTGSMTGKRTYWQKCSGIGIHLSVAPTAPASSTSFRFKPWRISHLISALRHGHNAKPFPYRAQFVLEKDNRAPDLTMRSLNQRLGNHIPDCWQCWSKCEIIPVISSFPAGAMDVTSFQKRLCTWSFRSETVDLTEG